MLEVLFWDYNGDFQLVIVVVVVVFIGVIILVVFFWLSYKNFVKIVER